MLTLMGLTRLRASTVIRDGADIGRLRTSERSHAGFGWVPQ
jgi:branched-chain amino acid transport system ATP-binding protein